MVNFEASLGGGGGDYLAREKVSVSLVPRYGVEQGMLSVEKLRKIWEGEVSDEAWEAVEIVDWERLRFRRQVHDVISLVTVDVDGAEREPGEKPGSSKEAVFKCVLQEQRYMYNELKMLLLLDRHPNVISRVVGVVTKRGRFGAKRGVCGLLLEWFPLGSLRGMLLRDDYHERVSVPQKLRWATQITEALIHVNSLEHAGFYSDLKPDNLVLKRDGHSGMLDAVLIDLEQRGGWFSWSPPEVTYLEYLEVLLKNRITEQLKEYYDDPEWLPAPNNQRYSNAQGGFSSPWRALLKERKLPGSRSRRLEQAQVFMLGKLLWCIFEGQPRVRCGLDHELLRDPSLHYDAERTERVKGFPEFKHTPPSLQQLIKECTAGAQEWDSETTALSPTVLLCSGKLYAGHSGCTPDSHVKDTVMAGRGFWVAQLERAQEFLRGQLSLRGRTESGQGNRSGSLASRASLDPSDQVERRPRFQHVLETLRCRY
ncbi:uncharacterized protein C8A04DRAFT_38867 [Dichotomopilus funicola]|uniref:Protein kinase domain-containing protein n=1 Tax=Dichotomopilus funicola TaxID=1934379 RepID=A0AAN6UZ52_9PEZI|nr:hypothetical protein C8A04DRAFT_38867 [Dichotomopilus funicola]